jgi:hypothetical protein
VATFGYTMMCEQSRPDALVRDLQQAEDAGFDFSVISDHYFPWLHEQGHSGYAWSLLGAAAHDVEEHVRHIRPYVEAGFTEVALVQIGGEQQAPFIAWAERELLPALRAL